MVLASTAACPEQVQCETEQDSFLPTVSGLGVPIGTASPWQGFPPRPVLPLASYWQLWQRLAGVILNHLLFSNCSGIKQTRPHRTAESLQDVIIFSPVIESQFGWEGTAPPARAQGQQPQAAQGFVQSGFENLWGWELHSFSGQPAVLQQCSQGKSFALYPVWTSSFNLWPLCLILLPSPLSKEPDSL